MSERNYIVLEPVRYNGTVYRPRPGVAITVSMPDRDAGPLIEKGILAAIESDKATDDQLSIKTVIAAIDDLVRAVGAGEINKEDAYTKSGKPHSNVLSERLGQSVSAALRDAAWEQYQAQRDG